MWSYKWIQDILWSASAKQFEGLSTEYVLARAELWYLNQEQCCILQSIIDVRRQSQCQ